MIKLDIARLAASAAVTITTLSGIACSFLVQRASDTERPFIVLACAGVSIGCWWVNDRGFSAMTRAIAALQQYALRYDAVRWRARREQKAADTNKFNTYFDIVADKCICMRLKEEGDISLKVSGTLVRASLGDMSDVEEFLKAVKTAEDTCDCEECQAARRIPAHGAGAAGVQAVEGSAGEH